MKSTINLENVLQKLSSPMEKTAAEVKNVDDVETSAAEVGEEKKVEEKTVESKESKESKELKDEKIPNARSGKTLLIQGKILHYQGASSSAVATAGVEFVVARIELVDKDSGRVLGVANCAGWTSKRVTLGVPEKAEGLARAIVKWIDKHYPESQRIK